MKPGTSTTDLAFQILETAGRPMHYALLTYRVIVVGGHFNGKTPWYTLRTGLAHDPRFERVGERIRTGMYALASWSPDRKSASSLEIATERRKAATYREMADAARLRRAKRRVAVSR